MRSILAFFVMFSHSMLKSLLLALFEEKHAKKAILMIIDFTISNFRSIKEKHIFSLFAEGSANHLKNNIAYPCDNKIGILRTAGIYGANASGKSNLLLAFEALRYIICKSGDLKDGDLIPCYEPYLLSDSTKNAPTTFEIEFSTKNKRFLYSVSFTLDKIINESLDFYPVRQKANLFNRKKGQNWENMTFGAHYKGGKKKYAFFQNNSYLSKAGNSADSPELIRSIYNYFRSNILHLGAEQKVQMQSWKDKPVLIQKVAQVLAKVDTGISGIEFKEEDVTGIDFPKNVPENIKRQILSAEKKKAFFLHQDDKNNIQKFSEKIESSGTIKLFNTIPMLIEAFNEGGILILDELDNSFHPHIAELIIQLFNDPLVNTNNSQLIFSTHNINLMSPKILRRDQIWFTEKNNGATTLCSLAEYDKSTVKTDSPYNKWYEEGRFGAIPNIDIGKIAEILSEGLD